nr:hypothetical protein [Candidatus Sigynarchaeota archaeon]
MATNSANLPVASSEPATKGSWARNLIADLPYALAFFQFMLLYLPYGFASTTGNSLPYTNMGFIAGLTIPLLAIGPAFGLIGALLIKLQRKSGPPGSWTYFEARPALVPIVSYGCAVMSIVMYFVEIRGWIADLVPLILFFAGVIISGILSMLGLMARRASRNEKMPGLPFLLAIVIIGAMWIFPATMKTESLLFVHIIVVLAIPPLIALGRVGRPEQTPSVEQPSAPVQFAWCDRFLATGDGPRTFMGTAIMLFLVVAFASFFDVVRYLRVPTPDYGLQAFVFFSFMGIGVFVFMTIFKKRDTSALFLITAAILIPTIIINDYVPRFSLTPLSLVFSGTSAGAALTLFFRAQAARNDSSRIKDFAGSRIIEVFYYTLLAAILGLIFNFTITWKSLKVDIPGIIPPRTLFGGIMLGIAGIIFLVFTSNSRYLTGIDRGEVKKKAGSMAELIGGVKEGPAETKVKQDDAMVAAFLGGGKKKEKSKEKKPEKEKKQDDAMVAAFLG